MGWDFITSAIMGSGGGECETSVSTWRAWCGAGGWDRNTMKKKVEAAGKSPLPVWHSLSCDRLPVWLTHTEDRPSSAVETDS